MKKLIGRILVGVLPLAGILALVPLGQSTASAATTAWSTLQQQAFRATSQFRGDGPLSAVGSAGPVMDGTVPTEYGPVSVTQRTVVAQDQSGTVVVQMAVLGGSQLIVTEVSPSSGYSGDRLVLAPGTTYLDHAYPVWGSWTSGTSTSLSSYRTRHRHHAILASDAVLHLGHRARHHRARLVTYGGCYAAPQAPGVIGSVYGPLVMGEGIIECPGMYSLSLMVGLDRWSTQVSLVGGSTYTYYYALNVFYGCHLVSAQSPFQTVQLWSVNGVLQPGASSTYTWLGCS